MSEKRLLVLGVGNEIMGDDAVGLKVVRELKKKRLPEYVEVVEGGTLSFQLLNFLDRYDKIIIVDAIYSGGEPGDVKKLRFSELAQKIESSAVTSHDFDFFRVLKILGMIEKVPEAIVVGVEVERISFGERLSEKVEKGVLKAVEKIIREIELFSFDKVHQ